MKDQTGKNKTIETLRGTVIILVVTGHVIGSGPEGGMQVKNDSFLRYCYGTFISLIQMPLFTVIAGFVYAYKPAGFYNMTNFLKQKASRILVPMLVVGVCYFLLQYFTPGTNAKKELTGIWKLLFFPYTLFWYLYSLFLVFIVIALIDSLNAINSFFYWFIVFCITLFILILRDMVIPFELPDYFSYKGALYLLPCFILGVGLNRFKSYFHNRLFKYTMLLILTTSVVIQQLSWFKMIPVSVTKDNALGLLVGLSATVLLMGLKIEATWLTWFGSYAYTIFLFHAFGTAAARIILRQFHIEYTFSLFVSSLAAGLLLPVVAEAMLEKFNVTRWLFLGHGLQQKNRSPLKSHPVKTEISCSH